MSVIEQARSALVAAEAFSHRGARQIPPGASGEFGKLLPSEAGNQDHGGTVGVADDLNGFGGEAFTPVDVTLDIFGPKHRIGTSDELTGFGDEPVTPADGTVDMLGPKHRVGTNDELSGFGDETVTPVDDGLDGFGDETVTYITGSGGTDHWQFLAKWISNISSYAKRY